MSFPPRERQHQNRGKGGVWTSKNECRLCTRGSTSTITPCKLPCPSGALTSPLVLTLADAQDMRGGANEIRCAGWAERCSRRRSFCGMCHTVVEPLCNARSVHAPPPPRPAHSNRPSGRRRPHGSAAVVLNERRSIFAPRKPKVFAPRAASSNPTATFAAGGRARLQRAEAQGGKRPRLSSRHALWREAALEVGRRSPLPPCFSRRAAHGAACPPHHVDRGRPS